MQMVETLTMPGTPDEQRCHLTNQSASPSSPLHTLLPSSHSLANLVTLELRENLLKSLPT